jgi:hypothetical protein
MVPQAEIDGIHEGARIVKNPSGGRDLVYPVTVKLDCLGAVVGLAGFDDTE